MADEQPNGKPPKVTFQDALDMCPDCVKLKRRIAEARWGWWRRHLQRKLALHQAIAGAGWP